MEGWKGGRVKGEGWKVKGEDRKRCADWVGLDWIGLNGCDWMEKGKEKRSLIRTYGKQV